VDGDLRGEDAIDRSFELHRHLDAALSKVALSQAAAIADTLPGREDPQHMARHSAGTLRHDGRIAAYSSEHSVLLAYGWPRKQLERCVGVAIRRLNPDGTVVWLEGLLGFADQRHRPGELISSSEGPIQKLHWSDFRVRRGQTYTYEVVPVFGRRLKLEESMKLSITIKTENNEGHTHQVLFNRAVVQSQAYARNFENADPMDDPRILDWLGRGLDDGIIGFIRRAAEDKELSIDVAAYHLEHPVIIEAIASVGPRARVSLFWPDREDEQERNSSARDQLRRAKVKVSLRESASQLSHNKYIILKDRNGPAAVLTGSANFTTSGVHLQNNVCHVIENRELAALYAAAFEHQFSDDTAAIRKLSERWQATGDVEQIEVNFSPHGASKGRARVDLDRFVELAAGAKESILFATLRITDQKLIETMTMPDNNRMVIRGLADNLYQSNEGEIALYHAAHEDPDVVAAPAHAFSPFPMAFERRREWLGTYWQVLVHHKFIAIDPVRDDNIVITGSANYSKNSSEKNDENTLIIRGNRRVAEMYLCEHARIYEHYRARWYLSKDRSDGRAPRAVHLDRGDGWLRKYDPNKPSQRFVHMLLAGA
jgi:phosphatidylserine/phosphatidylglycerophosphate/cardiolipin synthase-like enzyme